MPSGQRRGRWSGVPLQDRQTLRRDELVTAGIGSLGGAEGPALTVRAVCKAAGLTERYFYESFSDRDEFVRAVYDHVCTTAMSALATSESVRDAVQRFVALMVDDPARGRVLLIAPQREPVLAKSGADWIPTFVDLVAQKVTRHADATVQTMAATGLVGALTALFSAYLNGTLGATREQFIDYCVDMLSSRAVNR